MRHLRLSALLPALAIGAAVAGLALGDQKADSGAAKIVEGRITQVKPKDMAFTVRTKDGHEMRMRVDGKSRVRINQSDAELNEFTVGSRVEVKYNTRDGQNRV